MQEPQYLIELLVDVAEPIVVVCRLDFQPLDSQGMKPSQTKKRTLNCVTGSLGAATIFASISIGEIIDELKRRNIGLKYRIVDAREEIEQVLKLHEVK